LAAVSTAPVAIMVKISDCLHLKVNLTEKIYLYVNSTTQRCPNKIIKTFLVEDFFRLPLVSTAMVVHLELQTSSLIFENLFNSPKGILSGLGEIDSWGKNLK
jgi:hypothetical protein